jgi:hypothetical protein
MERRSFHSPPLDCVHSTRPIGPINWRTGTQQQRQHVSTPIPVRVKSGKNTEKIRLNTEFRKYGWKNSVSTSVRISTTSAPNSEPIPDFSENAKMDEWNVEKRTVRTGKNSVCFQRYAWCGVVVPHENGQDSQGLTAYFQIFLRGYGPSVHQ